MKRNPILTTQLIWFVDYGAYSKRMYLSKRDSNDK